MSGSGSIHRGCLILSGSRDQPFTFLRVATQFENIGDCLINRELVRLLAARSTLCLDLSACPPGFAAQLLAGTPPAADGTRAWRRSRWPFYLELLLARLRRRRCFWFQMPGGVTGSGPRSRPPAWLQDLPLPLAAALGVRLCQVGASFADLTTAHLARWRRRRRWLHRLCPRDSTSARYLSHHGIRHDGCIPDLAFQLFAHPRPLPAAGAAAAGGVCLSFRSDQTPGQAEAMAAAALALHRHLGHQRPWRAMVQVGRDRPGMERLRAVLEAAGCPIGPLSDHHGDIDACLAAYRQVSLVVSNRLHVLLMAASEGARILALIDGPGGAKLEGLLSDIGLQAAAMRSSQLALLEEGQPLGLTLEGRSMNATLQAAFDGLVPSSLPSSTSRWPRIDGSPGASQS